MKSEPANQPPLKPSDAVFPASAKAMQQKLGSRAAQSRLDEAGFPREVTPELIAFLERLNSFYLATATKDGRPYIQHRGGPPGFLKVLGPVTLGFADFAGNRQYITLGRLAENDAVCLFMMDYAHQARVKLWGRARVVADDRELIARLSDSSYRARVERAIVIEIDAWSQNCRQHIPQRFDTDDVGRAIETLSARIAALEEENERLRAGAGASTPQSTAMAQSPK